MNTILLFLAGAILTSTASVNASVRVEKLDWRGWTGCYRITNGEAELIFVPSVGRVMHFAPIGGSSPLWVNPKLVGKVVPINGGWNNYGGDKLWPAPQSLWGWPPDPAIDPGDQKVTILHGGKLLIEGGLGGKQTVKFQRTISMPQRGLEVRFTNVMTNGGQSPLEVGLWQITQIDDPEFAGMMSGSEPDGYRPFADNPPDRSYITRVGSSVQIRRNPTKSVKVGSDRRDGRAWSIKNGWSFETHWTGAKRAIGEMPHGNFQEIYTNPDPDKYVELELLTPKRALKPGEAISMEVVWKLKRDPSGR